MGAPEAMSCAPFASGPCRRREGRARKRLLVLGSVISGYTWDLLRRVDAAGSEVRVVHRSPGANVRTQLAHEDLQPRGLTTCDRTACGLAATLRFVDVFRADAVLLLGTRERVPMLWAMVRRRPCVPIFFWSDANVLELGRVSLAKRAARRILYWALARVVSETWTMGRSNDAAQRALGLRRTRALPFYAVNFDELGYPRDGGRDAPLRPGHIALLVVARLAPEKNLAALVEALGDQRLRDRATLTVVGDGPERGALERAAILRRVAVRFAGPVPRAAQHGLYEQSDALVLPSVREPWGIVVVEALGLGVPVVATPCVGAAVSLATEFSGVSIARGTSASALADAIVNLKERSVELAASAAREAGRVRARFGITEVAQKIARLVEGGTEDRGWTP